MLLAFDLAGQLEGLAFRCLAVAGAALVGFLAGGLLAKLTGRLVFKMKKVPDTAVSAGKYTGGLIAAIIAALLLFTGGNGNGLFCGGGGAGDAGKGTPATDAGKAAPAKDDPVVKPKEKPVTPAAPSSTSTETVVRVTFLGGDAVVSDKFYQLDDADPMTFRDLKDAVLARKAKLPAAAGKLRLDVAYPDDPKKSAAPQSLTVSQVTDWAFDQGISVQRPGKK